MTHSYNHCMVTPANLRLDNLLASLSLNLAEEGQQALERASGLTGSATTALLALEEFLDGAHVGRLAAVLGLTHSGAVRVVTQLGRDGLAERHEGADRGLVVSHLRLHRLRPARGPLPGATDRRASDRSIGWPRSHPDRPEPAGRDRWMDPASPSGQAERRATPSSTATVRR